MGGQKPETYVYNRHSDSRVASILETQPSPASGRVPISRDLIVIHLLCRVGLGAWRFLSHGGDLCVSIRATKCRGARGCWRASA